MKLQRSKTCDVASVMRELWSHSVLEFVTTVTAHSFEGFKGSGQSVADIVVHEWLYFG